MLYTGLIQHIAIQLHNALGYFQTDRNQENRGRGRSVEPLPTTKKNNANNNEGEGRVKVTEMIKGFPFRFEIFHHGISLGIGNFGKHKYQ